MAVKPNSRRRLMTILGCVVFIAVLYHVESGNQVLRHEIDALAKRAKQNRQSEHPVRNDINLSDKIISIVETSAVLSGKKTTLLKGSIVAGRPHKFIELEFTGKYATIIEVIKAITGLSKNMGIAEWSMVGADMTGKNPDIRVNIVLSVVL